MQYIVKWLTSMLCGCRAASDFLHFKTMVYILLSGPVIVFFNNRCRRRLLGLRSSSICAPSCDDTCSFSFTQHPIRLISSTCVQFRCQVSVFILDRIFKFQRWTNKAGTTFFYEISRSTPQEVRFIGIDAITYK